MQKKNVRFGVVNEKGRIEFEKKWQVQCGYDFISYDKEEATAFCRKKGNGWIVEMIYNVPNKVVNFKTTVFRSGNYKE